MLRFVLDVLLLRSLVKSRLARLAVLIFLAGALIAGLVYAAAVFHAVNERNMGHVQPRHSH